MGQWYKSVIKRENQLEKANAHDFDSGLKIMEHSYIGNNFVNVIANELVNNPARLFWVGDYAEEDDFASPSLYEEIYGYAWEDGNRDTTLEHPDESFDWFHEWYFVNETRKEYVKMPLITSELDISPIPLLTAVGNGYGCGDYWGNDEDMVGLWAGDTVYLTDTEPKGDGYADITAYCEFKQDF